MRALLCLLLTTGLARAEGLALYAADPSDCGTYADGREVVRVFTGAEPMQEHRVCPD
ncbi:hypothetical protein [Jannaschia donghaensis]|uniref:Secreted protein n=1 Tax=Jannaschia donghaensis TaxID=420998 RepID=A0A0M6YM34_9RHOB|nr:hypothetical protein [Jannaschia donghaensis]CTQ51000.1 hypothetical protein JDO7802_03034 [Jannaschia donghaensis]